MAKNSASRIAANNRYTEKTYDRFTFRVRKEDTERIKAAAGAQSMNSFIFDAIMEKLESGSDPPEIVPDLALYARQVGQTAEEYTAQAIRERMERQDREAEEIEHEPFFE